MSYSQQPLPTHPQQPLPPKETLPTMYDLPSEYPEELGLPDEFHCFQPQLLRETCQPTTHPQESVFVGTDLNVYYDVHHPGWHKRPDWFLVLGVEKARQQSELRWSYVIWQEGVSPFLALELLSPGTEAEDLGQTLREVNQPPTKWQVYEQILRIPYYAIFDRSENQFRLYQIVGTRYQEITLSDSSYWFDEMGLGIGVWEGEYNGVEGKWLRWQDADNNWIPTEKEQAETAQQQAETAQQQAKTAQQRAEKLAEKLKELGIDPEDI
ncbi:MAG: Uma2 family endonuclease [Cyanobacteria bacterium J06648_10]